MDLFVPGRLCLFGEHSDWAGAYRAVDPSVLPGYCLVAGTDQGLYAQVSESSDTFEISSRLPDGTQFGPVRISMTEQDLRRTAQSDHFAAYSAGVAYRMVQRYPGLPGVRIRIHRMDLPLKKGLSSSAAVCVMTARAFNLIYQLGMNVDEEMYFAYLGEQTTGSECGRMDQICAYGRTTTFLTFDGPDMRIETIHPGNRFPLLIVDLHGEKDTRRILSDLVQRFTLSDCEKRGGIRKALGALNRGIVFEARKLITSGEVKLLGRLMTEAQRVFDELVAPVCPSELTAPKLHALLNMKAVRELSEGAKGVGSQGDGCCQLVFSDVEKRDELQRILEAESGLRSFPLTLIPDGSSV